MAFRSCLPFTIHVPDRSEAFRRARHAIIEVGGKMDGDDVEGRFSGGGYEGRYEATGNAIEVTILWKPLLVPCRSVESEVRRFFR